VTVEASVNGEAFWRPGQRAQLYSQLSVGPIGGTVWARVGATAPVTPRAAAAALWLGLEATSSGALPTLATEVGPVAEVPVRPLGGSLAVRASTPVQELAGGALVSDRTTFGVAAYWAH
jgi:hypothetical protein